MKKWFEENKVYFETLTATLLSIMAILISIFQGCIANKEYKILEKKEQNIQISDYTKLRNAIDEILFSFPPNSGYTISSTYTKEQQIKFFERLNKSLNSQTTNTLLMDNPDALEYWRQASHNIKAYKNYIDPVIPKDKQRREKNLEIFVNSLFQDIFTVEKELINKNL